MTESAAVFNQTVSERSVLKKSAAHKKNGTAVAKLGNRRMSWQEIAEKHGECKTYDQEGFLTFSEFEKWPVDLKVEYVNKLMDKYDIELQHISLYLFHKGSDGLKAHLRNARMNNDRALKFCNYQKARAKTGLLQFQADIEEWKRREATAKQIDEMEAQRKREIIWNAEFISYDDFKALPLDGQIKYCNNMISKFQISLPVISSVLFEKNRFMLRDHFQTRKVYEQIAKASRYGKSATLFIEAFDKEVKKWKGIEVEEAIEEPVPAPIPEPEFETMDEAEIADVAEETNIEPEVCESFDIPSQIEENESEMRDMESVFNDADTYERWKTRKKSLLVKALLSRGKDFREVYPYLGYSESYWSNKLTRDSWSFEDLITVAHVEGLHFGLLDDNGELQYSIQFEDWFRDYDEKVLELEKSIKNKAFEEKRKEYEKLKAQLKEMNDMYGFEGE